MNFYGPIPASVWYALGALALAAVLIPGPVPIPPRWAKLNELHPGVRDRFAALYHRIESQIPGAQVVITSVHRPSPGPNFDYHHFGLAVDKNVVIHGVYYRSDTPKEVWEASGIPAIIRAAGFRWGGDFVTPYNGHPGYDPVHDDLGRDYAMAGLRARSVLLAKNSVLPVDGRSVSLTA